MSIEEYKFLCWLVGKVPSARVIRDMFRKKRLRMMKKEERERVIESIMEDIQTNLCNYEDFILGCVHTVISKWDDEDLCGWSGEEV